MKSRILGLSVLVFFAASPVSRAPSQDTVSRLSVTIIDDATGEPTPVRVRLTDASGAIAPLPEAAIAIMWGPNDRAVGYGFQPDSSFYVDGVFDVELQPGTYHMSLAKGQEYLSQQHEINIGSGDRSETFRLKRWINMPERGWFSADDHIHIRRSPRENPLILTWIAAEDIHVGALLQMGDFWATYFAQYAWGRDGVYQVEDYFLTSGQEEPRTHELGHTISLAADAFVRFRGEYYHYDRVFDRVHELGGLTGYAHKAVAFHGYRGMTLDVLRNKVDFLEILQFGTMNTEHYYHFLDLGFKLTATAGSDFPWATQIGETRFYTYVGDDFTFDNWRSSFHAGHTFVSNGPIIDLKVNGAIPGDELDVTRGSTLSITVRAFGHAEQVPLRNLEIVVH
ncbi:MAG: CehA/McbA family metallohydrolase, partial [Acidobacteria bacterium]|nr:CehA/McbA family metallohydrolase [Acidobacteriota bacterium]